MGKREHAPRNTRLTRARLTLSLVLALPLLPAGCASLLSGSDADGGGAWATAGTAAQRAGTGGVMASGGHAPVNHTGLNAGGSSGFSEQAGMGEPDPGTAGLSEPDEGGAAGTAGATGNATSGQWVLGYYVGYAIDQYPIASIDWSSLTHIAFAPMVVNDDLSLDFSFDDSNGTGTADARALAKAAHAHGVKALLMLGGADAGANIAAAAKANERAAFVRTLLDALTTLGYDGIDLDWEDSVDLDDFVALAQALRAVRPGILLSYPAGAINGNYQTVDPRLVTLAASLDRFNVQTYYPSTAYAGQGWSSWFSAPLSGSTSSTPVAIDDSLQRYAEAGIAKSKLGMGVGFYAICYTGGISGPRQATDGTLQRIVGGDNGYPLSLFFAAGGTFDQSAAGARLRDATAAEPYLSLPSAVNDANCGAATKYIAYEDETSLLAKGAFSRENGYGGIIIWTIQEGWLPSNAAGGRARNALMQALKAGFIDP